MKNTPKRNATDQPFPTSGNGTTNAHNAAGRNEAAQEKPTAAEKAVSTLYDAVEVLATVSVFVLILFAFVVRINVVNGDSMLQTLHNGERLAVSDLLYTPRQGDIVIIHRIDAEGYSHPLVKRVIAVGGQTVDIDFDTWTLTVDGEVVEESYRWLNPARRTLESEIPLPITLGENEVFVKGDNRNGSADSRQREIGPIDRRTIVGKALVRIFPTSKLTVFKNPFSK